MWPHRLHSAISPDISYLRTAPGPAEPQADRHTYAGRVILLRLEQGRKPANRKRTPAWLTHDSATVHAALFSLIHARCRHNGPKPPAAVADTAEHAHAGRRRGPRCPHRRTDVSRRFPNPAALVADRRPSLRHHRRLPLSDAADGH